MFKIVGAGGDMVSKISLEIVDFLLITLFRDEGRFLQMRDIT